MENIKPFWERIYNKLSWFVCELVMTFSNKPSFFASKRIERFALFVLVYGIIVGFVKRNWDKLTTDQMLMIVGTLLVAGGWNTVQIRKDRQADLPVTDTKKLPETTPDNPPV